mmetsp:Transcript_5111/g.14174  ORF Transcript_5111/g.14174 Transcript_5111/m.14174 type:complete len:202 (-) Transcript_5111:333-938(-)
MTAIWPKGERECRNKFRQTMTSRDDAIQFTKKSNWPNRGLSPPCMLPCPPPSKTRQAAPANTKSKPMVFRQVSASAPMQTLMKSVNVTCEGCHAAREVALASFTPVSEQNWSMKMNTPGTNRRANFLIDLECAVLTDASPLKVDSSSDASELVRSGEFPSSCEDELNFLDGEPIGLLGANLRVTASSTKGDAGEKPDQGHN